MDIEKSSKVLESLVNEAKNPFKKGDKIIVTKLQRQGDAKRFKGKKGFVLRDSSDNYVMVKLQGFNSPEIEFHMGEIELAESVNEGKDNLYLQLHKKYADQIKGLKAKKIKKLTDLVSVQRWAMEDEYDNSGFDRKAMSKQFNDERKLFKQYMAGDKTVSLKELDVRKVHGDKRIENPKTGNKVKLRTALKGKKGSKVYQTAKKIYNRLKDGE